MSVPFRFDTVLRIREIEREACRVAFAQEQARETMLREERDHIAAERLRALDELRTLNEATDWTAERAWARRQHAERLASDLAQTEASLREATAQLAQRRQALLEADVAVKALEKLAGRHRDEQARAEQVRDEHDRDDAWNANRAA